MARELINRSSLVALIGGSAALLACSSADNRPFDAGLTDAAVDAQVADAAQPDATGPLSQSSLYSDFASRTLAPGTLEFAPAFALWSDGADQRRWLQLPLGTTIDSSDMDHWVFPIGTRFFEQLSLGGVLLETRMIERTGPNPMDYWMGAFVWNAAQTEASFAPDGAVDINGTDHDAPPSAACWACHIGDRGRILGFSAIQLSRPGTGATLISLAQDGTLSQPPPPGADYSPPGDATVSAALGYLHANCGSCHDTYGVAHASTDQLLRLSVAERSPEATAAYRSAVGVHLNEFNEPGYSYRIVPGNPSMSTIVFRMAQRGDYRQMPPFASKHPDPAGIAAVSAWITGLH